MIKCALVVGGANGIGLSIATELAKQENCQKIYIVDKVKVAKEFNNPKLRASSSIWQTRIFLYLMVLWMWTH